VNGVPARPLGPQAVARLVGHVWRGNVRELENTVHRAVLLERGPVIGAEAIELAPGPGMAAHEIAGPAAGGAAAPAGGGVASLVGRRMEDVERDLILQTLGHTLGNRTHAATILGISIRALRNKLRDYAAHGAAVPPPPAGIAVPLPLASDAGRRGAHGPTVSA
jgi:DNA-binding NtrC family response regulator